MGEKLINGIQHDISCEEIGMLTAAVIKKEAGEYDVEVVQRLRVTRQALVGLGESLKACALLVDLALPHNRLTRLEGLGSCLRLASLDLSYNRISRVGGGLKGLINLRSLDLRANAIEAGDDLEGLSHGQWNFQWNI